MLASRRNDSISACFYLGIHKGNGSFDERIVESFQNASLSMSADQNTNFEIWLTLLIEKEERNFE
jgi:hypothetical protein